jgi:predicted RNA-binding Zn ribbon-like protein
MNLMAKPAATMKLVGGRLCLDFVNTVGGRSRVAGGKSEDANAMVILEDKLNDYLDLLAWSRHTGWLGESELQSLIREGRRRPEEARKVFERAVALREAIYRICKATLGKRQPQAVDLGVLNRELAEARSREKLASTAEGFIWEWSEGKNVLARMLWPVALSAAELMTSGDLTRLRECGGDDCRWLFEDTSRNRSRQWCNMQDCGNVAKVRRFRSRQRRKEAKALK